MKLLERRGVMSYSPVWDLDVFFEGGSDSASFAAYIKETEACIQALNSS